MLRIGHTDSNSNNETIMKTNNILSAIFTLVLAATAEVKAESLTINFDGAANRAINFAEALKTAPGMDIPLPREAGNVPIAATASPVAASQGITTPVYGENGTKVNKEIKYYVQVNEADHGRSVLWGVGRNNEVYSIGMARDLPAFKAPKQFADGLSPFELAAGGADRFFSCSNGCHNETAYLCVNGRAQECVITSCGKCWRNEERECECQWETNSAPHGCKDTGNPCQ